MAMADVFVSYSRNAADDAKVARELTHAIKGRGYSVFYDVASVVSAEHVESRITDELAKCKVLVVVLSSKATQSKWVQHEFRHVVERPDGPHVLPVLIGQHAKDNWVWPLVSDRNFIVYEDRGAAEKVVNEISKVVEVSVPPTLLVQQGRVGAGLIVVAVVFSSLVVVFRWGLQFAPTVSDVVSHTAVALAAGLVAVKGRSLLDLVHGGFRSRRPHNKA